MYAKDLARYSYLLSRATANMLSIGWLDGGQAFSVGEVPKAFENALLLLCERPINLMRGFHRCPFCNEQGDAMLFVLKANGERLHLGNGEIHVPGKGNLLFVAPTLIYHYVTSHNYRPPEEFISAVLLSTAPQKFLTIAESKAVQPGGPAAISQG